MTSVIKTILIEATKLDKIVDSLRFAAIFLAGILTTFGVVVSVERVESKKFLAAHPKAEFITEVDGVKLYRNEGKYMLVPKRSSQPQWIEP